MGKTLIQQARGKGGPSYRAPSFRYKTRAHMPPAGQLITGTVLDFVKSAAHTAPMAEIELPDGATCLMIAPEGIKVGDTITAGGSPQTDMNPGSIFILKDIPEGTNIYNIESAPGDGGKFCRTSGVTAKLTAKTDTHATIILPSKKERIFNLKCRSLRGS